jgi:hypothetical protein
MNASASKLTRGSFHHPSRCTAVSALLWGCLPPATSLAAAMVQPWQMQCASIEAGLFLECCQADVEAVETGELDVLGTEPSLVHIDRMNTAPAVSSLADLVATGDKHSISSAYNYAIHSSPSRLPSHSTSLHFFWPTHSTSPVLSVARAWNRHSIKQAHYSKCGDHKHCQPKTQDHLKSTSGLTNSEG